jgi:hypothetical protein
MDLRDPERPLHGNPGGDGDRLEMAAKESLNKSLWLWSDIGTLTSGARDEPDEFRGC